MLDLFFYVCDTGGADARGAARSAGQEHRKLTSDRGGEFMTGCYEGEDVVERCQMRLPMDVSLADASAAKEVKSTTDSKGNIQGLVTSAELCEGGDVVETCQMGLPMNVSLDNGFTANSMNSGSDRNGNVPGVVTSTHGAHMELTSGSGVQLIGELYEGRDVVEGCSMGLPLGMSLCNPCAAEEMTSTSNSVQFVTELCGSEDVLETCQVGWPINVYFGNPFAAQELTSGSDREGNVPGVVKSAHGEHSELTLASGVEVMTEIDGGEDVVETCEMGLAINASLGYQAGARNVPREVTGTVDSNAFRNEIAEDIRLMCFEEIMSSEEL